MISYDPVPVLAKFSERQGIGYPLLSDPKSEIIKAFDILNKAYAPGSPAYGIPHPIIFAIDANGIIRQRFSETDYAARPDIDMVLKALQ